jgi:RNA methyltransferase, TrmH family
MPVRIVQSKQNARLKELRRAFIRPGRDTHGLVGIEGPHLLEEAIRADLRVACVFVAQDAPPMTENLPVGKETEVLIVPRPLLNSALDTETPQAIAALVELPDWTWAHVLRAREAWPPLLVVLAGIQDPGNLGTILRSAEAFKATGVISLPGTVSAWNAKAVRSSAGSVFRVPLVTATPEECFSKLHEGGARVLTTAVSNAEPIYEANFTGPTAFLIGNEGSGVPADIAEHADAAVTIPCPGPVESLNAAVAASVLLYESFRQRAPRTDSAKELRGSSR